MADDEILTAYIKKLEEENSNLKAQIAKKSKVSFNKLWRDWWNFNSAFVWSIIIVTAVIGAIAYPFVKYDFAVATGKFYLETGRTGGFSSQICYTVRHEILLGQDDRLTNCIIDIDEAYLAAEHHRKIWLKQKQLNGE